MRRAETAARPARKTPGPVQVAPTHQDSLSEPDFTSELNMAQADAPGVSGFVTPGNILSLQRSLGNQAVQRMIQRQRSGVAAATGTIQRDGTAVAARPGVGAYAMGKAPRVNSSAPAPVAEKSPEEIQYDTTYTQVIGPSANNLIIEGLLAPAMQTVVLPELSKSILVKTRKDLAADIKGDAALYEQLGPDDAAREAALAGIMQQVVTSVVGRLPEFQPLLASVKNELSSQARALPASDMEVSVIKRIKGAGLIQNRAWVTARKQLEELSQQKTTFYSQEITKITKTYMEANGESLVDRMNAFLDEKKAVKARLRTQFNAGVDANLSSRPVEGPPPAFAEGPQKAAYATQTEKPKYRKENHNADTGQDYAEYVATGAGVASAAGGVATKIGQLSSSVVAAGTAATEAVNVFGSAGGIAGVASGAMETVRGVEEMSNSSATTSDRVMGGGGRAASGVASMVQQGGSAAFNIASLTTGSATSAAALTATAVAGGGGVAMGAVDMVRGGYGAYKGHQRQKQLNNIAEEASSDSVKSAAMQAASTQEMRKKVAGATVLKGALLVAGGVTLLLLATNPVGWILMGAAAVVGGLAAIWRFWQKTKRKKTVAIRELGVEAEFKKYEEDKKNAKKGWSPLKYKERQAAVAAIKGNNPLHKKMLAIGYKKNDYDKFYADYIHDTANVLHMNGVVLGNSAKPEYRQMRQIVENMGFEVNPERETPTPEQIGKALNV
jgi:hypothetical protein